LAHIHWPINFTSTDAQKEEKKSLKNWMDGNCAKGQELISIYQMNVC
jgi:hypothetical protein